MRELVDCNVAYVHYRMPRAGETSSRDVYALE